MIYFTSDLHFYHKNVIEYCKRPWKTVEEMNEGLIENWNSVVKGNDAVFILGDVFFCNKGRAKEIMNRLNGRKVLVRGNHDWDKISLTNETLGFDMITDFFSMDYQLPNQTKDILLLSHFPYKGDHTEEDRFKDRRPANFGEWLLHGHVHDLWKVKDKMINVGVDVWDFKPVSMEQIMEIILNKK